MKITYTIEGVEHTLELPESAIRQIYDAYLLILDAEDVESYIHDIEAGTIILPDNVTAEEIRKHKDWLLDQYRFCMADSDAWHDCLEKCVETYAFLKERGWLKSEGCEG